MTSSELHLDSNCSRWNYGVQQYKENRDVFYEGGLFSIVVIAHGRHDNTCRSVESTIKSIKDYPGEVEWIFIENGECEENYKYFMSLDLERKAVVRHKNYGINHAINQGWNLSRGEYVFIHENDWESTRLIDFLSPARDIFQEDCNIGMIQLRDPMDPHENHGRSKPDFNPWSCTPEQLKEENIIVEKKVTKNGHAYLVSEFSNGFNNNPIIIHKNVRRLCGPYPEPIVGSDPRHGETEYQKRVAVEGYATAYIGMPIYWHMGRIQTVGH